MPAWDIVERTLSGGMVLARARPAGVGSHGVGRTIEGVGSVAEEVEPSRVDVTDKCGGRGVNVKESDVRSFLRNVEGYNEERGDDIVEYGFDSDVRKIKVVFEEAFELVIVVGEDDFLDSDVDFRYSGGVVVQVGLF